MNYWCESCARKNLCYVVDDRPKCFVPITNTASGTPYLVEISPISRESHEIDTPQTEAKKVGYCNECKWFRNKQVCGRCRSKNLFAEADTPQTEICDTCKYRSSNVFGNWCVGRDTCDRYVADTSQTEGESR